MAFFHDDDGALVVRFAGETIRIEAWGRDSLRVRARPQDEVREPIVSALLPPAASAPRVEIEPGEEAGSIVNGRIRARVRFKVRHGADVRREPIIAFSRADTGAPLLEEARSHFASPAPRAYRRAAGETFHLEQTFASDPDEKLYGLGQPQHGLLDLKGSTIELSQQNTHVSIPFLLSSRGYGFLWNNPATGRVELGRNLTRWSADRTPCLDYWITAGDAPRDILRAYVAATGMPPEMPEWITGFWQSRLRYRTQREMLDVAREHRRRGLPLACIVIDFFHWTRHGEWTFDPEEWPDPAGMMRELREMGVESIVSIWPTVNPNAETYGEMRDQGLLMRAERGPGLMTSYPDKNPLAIHAVTYYDATLPRARAYLWEKARDNYLAHGLRNFWLDSCEPELRPHHPEDVRLSLGSGSEVLNAYPLLHIQGFREGLTQAGAADGALLVRSAWAGAQRHGIILWSGDVWSNWRDYRAQLVAGLQAGLSGIGVWTTDIGGFYDGHGRDPDFRELLVRWFEFGVFSPVCRLHGFRIPEDTPFPQPETKNPYGRETFSIFTDTGGANEVWSYGEEVYAILRDLLETRERLRPYVAAQIAHYARTGDPVMRPLFYDFPDDAACWSVADAYLFGPDLLVAPVFESGARARSVYLPAGADWREARTGARHRGGRTIEVEAPPGRIPLFIRDGRPDPTAPA
jgi:alpha-D-xyloside xylohydrolase